MKFETKTKKKCWQRFPFVSNFKLIEMKTLFLFFHTLSHATYLKRDHDTLIAADDSDDEKKINCQFYSIFCSNELLIFNKTNRLKLRKRSKRQNGFFFIKFFQFTFPLIIFLIGFFFLLLCFIYTHFHSATDKTFIITQHTLFLAIWMDGWK